MKMTLHVRDRSTRGGPFLETSLSLRDHAEVMSLVAMATALKAELGLPAELPAAAAILAAGEMMGIAAEGGEPLPLLAARIMAAVGCEIAGAGTSWRGWPAGGFGIRRSRRASQLGLTSDIHRIR